jgi:hypothetical protein
MIRDHLNLCSPPSMLKVHIVHRTRSIPPILTPIPAPGRNFESNSFPRSTKRAETGCSFGKSARPGAKTAVTLLPKQTFWLCIGTSSQGTKTRHAAGLLSMWSTDQDVAQITINKKAGQAFDIVQSCLPPAPATSSLATGRPRSVRFSPSRPASSWTRFWRRRSAAAPPD